MKKSFALAGMLVLLCCNSHTCYGSGILYSIEPITPYELVIIAGRHDNANMYTESMLEDAGLKELIVRSIYADQNNVATAHISIIVPDKDPTPITEVEMNAENSDGKNENTEKRNLFVYEGITSANEQEFKESMAEDILDYLLSDELKADSEEVDLLLAISEAQKLLADYPNSERYIVILDTGITTSGYLDMTKTDILAGTVNEVIEGIEDGAFADLTGIYVGFWNLGNVSGDQTRINNTVYEQRLADLWTVIIEEKCGGTLIQDELTCSALVGTSMSESDGYPSVRPVSFGSKTMEETETEVETETEPETETNSGGEIVTLGTFTLHFEADSADFVSAEEEAVLESHIKEIQIFLDKNPGLHLYIVGSVAQTSNETEMLRSNVAAERAQAVADILTKEYGIKQNRIIIIDAGTTVFTWRCGEEYSDGNMDTDAMAANRVAAIIAENSADVDELREAGYID